MKASLLTKRQEQKEIDSIDSMSHESDYRLVTEETKVTKATTMRQSILERETLLKSEQKAGIGRERGRRKVASSVGLYGLKGIGSKEGDVLTVKAFVQLFKTDKVSESIARAVRADYAAKILRELEN